MSSLKEWVILGRPHTASLTIPGTLLGAVVAGTRDPALLLLLGAWALLFHYFGFVHNNLADLAHDRADPSKGHFPLVSGVIRPNRARVLWAAGTALVEFLGIGIVLVWSSGAGQVWASLLLQAAIAAGAAYNVVSKRWRGGPFVIALSYAALPAFAFFAAGGDASQPALPYLVAYSFLLMLHDIGYAGYLKDLAPDPVNWLRGWGARADPAGGGVYSYRFPPVVQAWAWFSRLLCPALALAYVLTHAPTSAWPLALGGTLLFTLLLVVVFARLSRPGTFLRQRKLALMGASEALAYFVQVASLGAVLGTAGVAAFVGLPLVWFVAWNQALWGTWVGPRV
jgi:hypothetical protein